MSNLLDYLQSLEWHEEYGVLDLRSKGHMFETHWRHCVVSLIKTQYSLHTGSTQEDGKSIQLD